MNFSFVHDFDIDVPSYWKIFTNDGYNEQLYRELKMKTRDIIEQKDDGKIFRRVQKLQPDIPLPGFLAAIVKDTGYTEFDTLDYSRNSMEVLIEPLIMKDRFDMRGMYVVSPLGADRCRREFKGEIKISIALIGGKAEKFMMEQLRDAYDVAARVTHEWVKKYKAGAM